MLGGGLLVASSLRIYTAILIDDFLQPIDLGRPVRVLNVMLATACELVHRQLRLYGRELLERLHALGCNGVAGKRHRRKEDCADYPPQSSHDPVHPWAQRALVRGYDTLDRNLPSRTTRALDETRSSAKLGSECSGKRVPKLRQVPLLKRHYAPFLF